jgi:hypothetical protein
MMRETTRRQINVASEGVTMRKTIVGMIIVIVASPLLAFAGSLDAESNATSLWYLHQDTLAYPFLYPIWPTWTGTGYTWNSVWKDGPPPSGTTTIGKNHWLFLGQRNAFVDTNTKDVTITIRYFGTSKPSLKYAKYGSKADAQESSGELLYLLKDSTPGSSPGVYQVVYRIRPQPDWEYFMIKAEGGQGAGQDGKPDEVMLMDVTITSWCHSVPVLTGWGLAVLVILLAGTALWVIRKRRTALAR